jgi:hypothetical protein
MHNHIVIEPVMEVFQEFDTRIMARLRDIILEEFAASSKYDLTPLDMAVLARIEEESACIRMRRKDRSAGLMGSTGFCG